MHLSSRTVSYQALFSIVLAFGLTGFKLYELLHVFDIHRRLGDCLRELGEKVLEDVEECGLASVEEDFPNNELTRQPTLERSASSKRRFLTRKSSEVLENRRERKKRVELEIRCCKLACVIMTMILTYSMAQLVGSFVCDSSLLNIAGCMPS